MGACFINISCNREALESMHKRSNEETTKAVLDLCLVFKSKQSEMLLGSRPQSSTDKTRRDKILPPR
jgi:hypothetical protein